MAATSAYFVLLQAEKRFEPLSNAERKLLSAAQTGEEATCGRVKNSKAPENDPSKADTWGKDRTIRAAMIEWLCFEQAAREQVHTLGIRVFAARMEGKLDISFATIPFPLFFRACWWAEQITLHNTSLPELGLTKCWVGPLRNEAKDVSPLAPAIDARGLRVEGSVLLNDGFCANCEVSLAGAQIGGGLDCTEGSFKGASLSCEIKNVSHNATGLSLNAKGTKIGRDVLLKSGFKSKGGVNLSGATIGGSLYCTGGNFSSDNLPTTDEGESDTAWLPGLDATGAKIEAHVLLCDGFESEGEVKLFGATIGGVLACQRGNFRNARGLALNATLAKIDGGVQLSPEFRAEGGVRLFGARIGGTLECDGGSFKNAKGPSLDAEGAKVDGGVLLRGSDLSGTFRSEGEVRLLHTEIGLALECDGGYFGKSANGAAFNAAASRIALNAAAVRIGRSATLRDGFQANGEILFTSAVVNGDLIIGRDLEGEAERTATIGDNLDIQHAEIKGALNVAGMRTRPKSAVNLMGASCNVLIDEVGSWPREGKLALDGFVYRRMHRPEVVANRLDWLRLQLPSDYMGRKGSFRPQPYRQLASVLRAQGHDVQAKKILIGMAKDRCKWADLRWSRGWQWFLWITIANGYQPLRSLYFLLALWIFGFAAFGWGYQKHAMVPTDHFAYQDFAGGAGLPGQYEPFCAPFYAIDTTLPIVSLGQRDRWHPGTTLRVPVQTAPANWVYGNLCEASFLRGWDLVEPSTLAESLAAFRWFYVAVGWFFATMFLAGISGLVGRE